MSNLNSELENKLLLLDFPTALSSHIYSTFLSQIDIVRIDTAVCNRSKRCYFLEQIKCSERYREYCKVGNDQFYWIFKRNIEIKYLSLSNNKCFNVNECIIYLSPDILRNLEYIDLSGCAYYLSDYFMNALISGCNSHNIVYLNISHCDNISDHSMVPTIMKCESLTHLDISYCVKLSPDTLKAIALTSTNLQILNCRQYTSTSDSFPNMNRIWCDILKNCLKLREISIESFGQNNIADVIAKYCGTRLEKLRFDNFSDLDDEQQSLITIAEGCSSLTSLGISKNTLIFDDHAIVKAVSYLGCLTSLDISNMERMDDRLLV